MSYTSKFGPREETVGSVATNAASQSFTALCTSFKWPHLGCLISPARYVELNLGTDQRHSYHIIKPRTYGLLYNFLL